jgi:hypothetical protein
MKSLFSDEMTLFVNIFQMFSVFPYSANEFVQILLRVYATINLLVVGGIFCSAYFLFPIFSSSENLSSLVGGLVFNGLLITHAVNLIQAYATRNEQGEIYQKFDEIDYILNNQLLVNINYKNLRHRLFIKNLIIQIVVLCIHVVCVITAMQSGFFHSYHVHLILTNFIIRLRCLQNMFYVDLMNDKLNLMNKKLRDIINRNHDKLSLILFPEQMMKQRKDTKGGIKNSSLYEQLLSLKQIYGKIWDITNLINDCFGWSLLVIVTEYFIEFTSNGYWLFLALVQNQDKSIAILSLCSIFPIVILLTVFAYSCYQCSENAQQTGVLIHKIERDINNDLQNALVNLIQLNLIRFKYFIFTD